jgi:hypothetical protein
MRNYLPDKSWPKYTDNRPRTTARRREYTTSKGDRRLISFLMAWD